MGKPSTQQELSAGQKDFIGLEMRWLFLIVLSLTGLAWGQPVSEKVELHFYVLPEHADFFLWGVPEDVGRDEALASGKVARPFVVEKDIVLAGPLSITFRAEGYIDETRTFDLTDMASNSSLLFVPPDKRPLQLTKKPSSMLLFWLGGSSIAGLALAFFTLRRRRELEEKLLRHRDSLHQLEQKVKELSGLFEGLKSVSEGRDEESMFRELEGLLNSAVEHEVGQVLRLEDGVWTAEYQWPELAPNLWQRLPKPKYSEKGELQLREQGSEWPNYTLTLPLTQEPKSVVLLGRSDADFSDQEIELAEFGLYQTAQSLEKARLLVQAQAAQADFEGSQQRLLQAVRLNTIGDMGAGVAHHLNTPLGAVSLSIEGSLALMKDLPKPVENLLQTGLEAIFNCQSIIDRLFTFTRDELKGEELVPLANVVKNTLKLLESKARDQEVELLCDVDEEAMVTGRSNELSHLVLNLVKNALEASAPGSSVKVSVQRENEFASLSVEDQGHGISQEDMEKIFQPFFSTRAMGQGRGLGLSICEQIATRHGANIRVTSKEQGSVFGVTFDQASKS